MENLYSSWVWAAVFLFSLASIIALKYRDKNKVQSQCVVTLSVIMIIFYCICFLSGICTILNFIFKWII